MISAGRKGALRTRSSIRSAISAPIPTSATPASIRCCTIIRPAGATGAIRRRASTPGSTWLHNPDVAGVDPLEHYLQHGLRRGPRHLSGDRRGHRRRLRRRMVHAAQSRRRRGGRRCARTLRQLRLARGAQPQRLVRHRRVSRALRRRRGRRRQPARSLHDVRVARGPRCIGRLRYARLSGGELRRVEAMVNPLEHFLTFGIYEGRSAVNDGVWH